MFFENAQNRIAQVHLEFRVSLKSLGYERLSRRFCFGGLLLVFFVGCSKQPVVKSQQDRNHQVESNWNSTDGRFAMIIPPAPQFVLRVLEETYLFGHLHVAMPLQVKKGVKWRLFADEPDNLVKEGLFSYQAELDGGKGVMNRDILVGPFCDGASDEVPECLACSLTDGCVLYFQFTDITSGRSSAQTIWFEFKRGDDGEEPLCPERISRNDCRKENAWFKVKVLGN